MFKAVSIIWFKYNVQISGCVKYLSLRFKESHVLTGRKKEEKTLIENLMSSKIRGWVLGQPPIPRKNLYG